MRTVSVSVNPALLDQPGVTAKPLTQQVTTNYDIANYSIT
jgi:hypothetical protein